MPVTTRTIRLRLISAMNFRCNNALSKSAPSSNCFMDSSEDFQGIIWMIHSKLERMISWKNPRKQTKHKTEVQATKHVCLYIRRFSLCRSNSTRYFLIFIAVRFRKRGSFFKIVQACRPKSLQEEKSRGRWCGATTNYFAFFNL